MFDINNIKAILELIIPKFFRCICCSKAIPVENIKTNLKEIVCDDCYRNSLKLTPEQANSFCKEGHRLLLVDKIVRPDKEARHYLEIEK